MASLMLYMNGMLCISSLAETAKPLLRGPEQVQWIERLAGEHANFSAAMTWLLEQGDTTHPARLEQLW